MTPDKAWVCSSITVVVRAENEDDQKYEWSECLAISDQVKKLADAWAQAHGVPPSAVGFDDANGCEVDLMQTPLSLGWTSSSEVVLTAFPTEDRFMEQIANEGEDAQDDGSAPAEGGEFGATVHETPSKTLPSEQEVQGQAWDPQAAPSEDSPAPTAAAALSEAANAAAVALAAASSELPRQRAPLGEAAGVAPAAAVPSRAPTSRTRGAAAEVNNASRSRGRGHAFGGQQEASKEPKRGGRGRGGGSRSSSSPAGRGRGAAAVAKATEAPIDSASTPTEAEAIVFEQTNPKKEGSSAYQRYERYKRARTVSEALTLGAAKGDIAHDFKRGFLKRRRGT